MWEMGQFQASDSFVRGQKKIFNKKKEIPTKGKGNSDNKIKSFNPCKSDPLFKTDPLPLRDIISTSLSLLDLISYNKKVYLQRT